MIRYVVGRCTLPLACSVYISLAFAGPIDDVKVLFEQGRAKDALALAKRNPQLLGNPQFDYFYGLAAIDSGEPGEGVLALERFLLNTPDSNAARLELGRGYFLLGDNVRAREMFEDVNRRDPPAQVRNRANEFLEAIRQRESIYRTAVTGFVELGGGHDSNVNSGTNNEIITIPFFGSVTIDPAGREQADRFAQIAAGLQISKPLTSVWSIFGGLNGDARGNSNSDANQYDQRNLSAAVGASRQQGEQQWRLSLAASELDVDAQRYRTLAAGTIDWQRKSSDTRSLTLYGQVADIRYTGDNAARNAHLYSLGSNWRNVFAAAWQPLMSIGLNVGRERNSEGRDDLGRTLFGGNASVACTLSPRWGAALTATVQRSRYGAEDVFFAARRVDNYRAAEFVLGRAITANLSARLEASRTDNRSNIALFQYARTQVALKLRYDMK